MEYRIEADQFWPPVDADCVGVRDSVLVPPSDLSDPEVLSFRDEHLVVTPGWINSHAHLELSGARGIEFNGNFVDWIFDVLDFKTSLDDGTIREDFREGCADLVESGVARVVDHCDRTDLILEELDAVDPDVVPLKELIAFDGESIDREKEEAELFLEEAGRRDVPVGLAPHAPYSAHPELYRWADERLGENGVRSTHLHEVSEELEFAEEGSGGMMELLRERSGSGVESPYDGDRPIPYLTRGGYVKNTIFGVHLNYTSDEDLRWLEAGPVRPVFCPRSYSYFRHETLPIEDWVERSLAFGLGTDSRASNESLDMLAELRCLDELTDEVTPESVLRALTVVPANVLGAPGRGVLSPGTPADLSVFSVPDGNLEALSRGRAEARAVMVDGEVRWSSLS